MAAPDSTFKALMSALESGKKTVKEGSALHGGSGLLSWSHLKTGQPERMCPECARLPVGTSVLLERKKVGK